MIETKKLERIVAFLNRMLSNPRLHFAQSSSFPRPETPSIADLTTNFEFQEELRESLILEDNLYFLESGGELPNQATIEDGHITIVVDGSKSILPIDDIEEVEIIKTSKDARVVFSLCEGYYEVTWMTEKQMATAIKWSQVFLRRARNIPGDWVDFF